MWSRVVALLASISLVACQPASPSVSGSSGAPSTGGSQVTVGAVFSLTGAASVYGVQQRNAVQLAADEINSKGILGNGRTLKLVVEDDRSVKEGAIPAFEKLIGQDKAAVILGPTLSANALAADPIAQDRKVVVMGVSNTANGITEMGDFVFRDSLPEAAVIPNTIRVTQQKLNYKKVALMYGDDDAFTKSGYDVFKQSLDRANVQIVATETFKKGDTDFSAQLTKIRGLGPEAIVVSALAEEAAGIMTQGRSLGIPASVPFIGGNGFNSLQLIKLAGPAAEGAIVGAAWFITGDAPGNQEFVRAFKAKYNTDPDQFAAQAYAGMYLAAAAIKNAPSGEPKAIRDALDALKNVDTVLGTFSFEKREPVHTPIVQVVRNGAFELYR